MNAIDLWRFYFSKYEFLLIKKLCSSELLRFAKDICTRI